MRGQSCARPAAAAAAMPACILCVTARMCVGAGARRGLLLRGGGAVLESLAGVRAVVLDKTGTLTEGEWHSCGP